MDTNFIALFDPAKATDLTQEQLATLKDLTNDQLKELAKAYPNKATGANYLVLFNTQLPANKQLYPLSTWANFSSIRNDLGQKHWYVLTFKNFFIADQHTAPKTDKIQDLTGKQLQEGLKAVTGIVQNPNPIINDEKQPGAGDGQDGKKIDDGKKDETIVISDEQKLLDEAAKKAAANAGNNGKQNGNSPKK